MLPARDVERRIEGIKSRVSELNDKCKVPSVFCYKSKHSNSLIVQGDTELLFSVNHEEGLKRGIPVKTYTVCLPPLQKSLAKMTIRELQANLIGIMKDLTHSWDGESPQWWPKEVPFRNPRKTPKKLKGKRTDSL